MKFTAHVLLPKETENVEEYLKKILYRYYIEREVEPYKTKYKEPIEQMLVRRKITFEELQLNCCKCDEWIEDGYVWYISTWNREGNWDYYWLEEVKLFQAIDYVPSAFVDIDGEWHDDFDFGYKMKLDKYTFDDAIIHPDNVEAMKKFETMLKPLKEKFSAYRIAVLRMHS